MTGLLRRLLAVLRALLGSPAPPRQSGPLDAATPESPPTVHSDDGTPQETPMPETCTVLQDIPIFERFNDTSSRTGTAKAGDQLPYLGQQVAQDSQHSVWFQVVAPSGDDAWLVAESGKTYAVLSSQTRTVPPGGAWDVLLDVAQDPKLAAARYGFSSGRTGGAQQPNPEGYSWPRSQYNNCVTFVAQALQLARHKIGLGGSMSKDDWATVCIWAGYGERGGPAVAARWGIGTEPIDIGGGSGFTGPLSPGWWVCQGWNAGDDGRLDTDDDLGHSFFLRVVSDDEVYFLESRGRAAGGPLNGQDGISSRTTSPRNVRDWSGDGWPDALEPTSRQGVQDTYEECWASKLDDSVST